MGGRGVGGGEWSVANAKNVKPIEDANRSHRIDEKWVARPSTCPTQTTDVITNSEEGNRSVQVLLRPPNTSVVISFSNFIIIIIIIIIIILVISSSSRNDGQRDGALGVFQQRHGFLVRVTCAMPKKTES